jgi:broad specificity phosphatase PhoE
MAGTELLLIRHAQSEWNAAGRWQGLGDPPLSSLGREQARRLAERLAAQPIDRLICSDLRRAVETAEAIGEALGLVPQPDAALRERDVGRWTGLTRSEIEEADGPLLRAFGQRDDPDIRPGGGESTRELEHRVREAVSRLVAEAPEARTALVVHLGVIRALVPGHEADHTEVTPFRV